MLITWQGGCKCLLYPVKQTCFLSVKFLKNLSHLTKLSAEVPLCMASLVDALQTVLAGGPQSMQASKTKYMQASETHSAAGATTKGEETHTCMDRQDLVQVASRCRKANALLQRRSVGLGS